MAAEGLAGLAAGLEVLGVGVVFGLRSWLQRRATGDSGVRRPTEPVARVAGPLFMGGLAGTLLGLALAAVGVLGPPTGTPTVLRWGGLALAAAGFAGAVGAQVTMGSSWRMGVDRGERTALVTSGAFAVVRNPFFTATGAAVLGLVLAAPSPVTVAGLACVMVSMQLQVRCLEEPYLLATHDAAYAEYARRVGRFVPGVGRLRGAPEPAGLPPTTAHGTEPADVA